MRIKIQEKKLFKKLINRNFNFELKDIDSLCIDSRLVQKNDIFVPIKGNHIDPHNFISEVLTFESAQHAEIICKSSGVCAIIFFKNFFSIKKFF